MNPYVLEMMLQEKREEMVREAEHQRLLASARKGETDSRKKTGLMLAELLITAGQWMKRRYNEPSTSCHSPG